MLNTQRLSTAFGFMAGAFARLSERLRLMRLYPTVRNRVVAHTILLLVAGMLFANGLIFIPIALVVAAFLSNEV